jgi:hypothetical protein
MIKMPWYTNPIVTCKVLGKIANRYEYTTLQDLKFVLDSVVDLIQKKQERYHEIRQKPREEVKPGKECRRTWTKE